MSSHVAVGDAWLALKGERYLATWAAGRRGGELAAGGRAGEAAAAGALHRGMAEEGEGDGEEGDDEEGECLITARGVKSRCSQLGDDEEGECRLRRGGERDRDEDVEEAASGDEHVEDLLAREVA